MYIRSNIIAISHVLRRQHRCKHKYHPPMKLHYQKARRDCLQPFNPYQQILISNLASLLCVFQLACPRMLGSAQTIKLDFGLHIKKKIIIKKKIKKVTQSKSGDGERKTRQNGNTRGHVPTKDLT